MEGFTAQQASRFTGCTAHQLRYWDRIALLRPSVQSTGGRPGVRRLYSFRDLIALKVIYSLLDAGMSLQQVRRAYSYLRKKADLEAHLSEVKLVTDGSSIFKICHTDGEVIDALKEGQMAFFLALDDVANGVDERVAEYLYDRKKFVQTLADAEAGLQRELGSQPPAAEAAGSSLQSENGSTTTREETYVPARGENSAAPAGGVATAAHG
jgi:DNA-binding transcriptional MerR regulator